jgi:hypothetical protein
MKTNTLGVIGVVALLLASANNQTWAIEGLNVSVQSSNVVLSWPSVASETYIVQYRPSLGGTSSWQTLTSVLPAAVGTNLIFYVHSDAVSGGTTNIGFYRVVRNDVHLFGLTNGIVLSGVVDVPIEMSLSSTDQITGISFYADGNPLVGAIEKSNGSPWIMEWDTSMVTNGTYLLNAGVDFAGDDSVTNAPVTVTVSNLISFPNYFTRIFGGQMWVYAELAVASADYEIAMYASETNYIGSFHGSTSDGVISFLWDLTDGGGYTFTDEAFSGVFNITPSGKSDPTAKTNFWAKELAWSGIGKFVVAYSGLNNNSTVTWRIGLMVAGGPSGELWGRGADARLFWAGALSIVTGQRRGRGLPDVRRRDKDQPFIHSLGHELPELLLFRPRVAFHRWGNAVHRRSHDQCRRGQAGFV